MKRVLMWVVLLGVVAPGRAQTFAEWFQQNKTRKEYQEKQIGELQLYITALEKGYGIVESGLNTIKGIKSGEFDLHNGFYASLRSVSPVVSGMAEVGEIVALQAAMINRFSAALARYRQTAGLRTDEVAYLTTVYGELVKEGLADVTMLTDILTAGTLQLSDDERMRRIVALDGWAKERYLATVALTGRTDVLAAERAVQAGDVGSVKGLYGLP